MANSESVATSTIVQNWMLCGTFRRSGLARHLTWRTSLTYLSRPPSLNHRAMSSTCSLGCENHEAQAQNVSGVITHQVRSGHDPKKHFPDIKALQIAARVKARRVREDQASNPSCNAKRNVSAHLESAGRDAIEHDEEDPCDDADMILQHTTRGTSPKGVSDPDYFAGKSALQSINGWRT